LSVLALGLVSMALLVWTRQVDERRAADAAVANRLTDLRVRVATAHLWTDQVDSGTASRGERALAESALLSVAPLVDVLDARGDGTALLTVSRGPAGTPLSAELKELTSKWLAVTEERLRGRQATGADGVPIAERAQAAFDALQQKASDLERIVETEQVADMARSRRLFQGLLLAWSMIVVASTITFFRRERGRAEAEEALRAGQERLATLVAQRTGALHDVTAALLTAQETERLRISTELHDQLGHALILIKFQIAMIARELTPDQSNAREGCAELCDSVDRTIEDVRRLARDLRPSVLEELGLSAALRWLVDCGRRDGRPVAAAITDVDQLVPRNAQVVVYRIVQQALTNAARHSEASEVSLRVSRDEDRLWFVVEDDGQGFDMSQVATADPARRGLGLAIMRERASMVGGSLDVCSVVGKGTRVTLGFPVPLAEAS
jgi:signal transduction histidine kinase